MTALHGRYEDQDGFVAKLKWIVSQSFCQGIAGVLISSAIMWAYISIAGFPTTYAQKADISDLRIKQAIDYRDLDARKMNKDDYLREHALLRDEMNRGFDKMVQADDKLINIMLQVRASQLTQYKKVNKELDK